MDDLKLRATERFEALHIAAKTAADNSSSRVQDVYNQSADTVRKIQHAIRQIWNHELIVESRIRVVTWTQETIKRIREGAPPLSPVLLYEELVALFRDRVWRRSMLIFCAGCMCGVCLGLAIGLRWSTHIAEGPHCRALHSTCDGSVVYVDDATIPGAGAGEVLVRVQAFSVSCVDRAVLRGRGASLRALLHSTNVTVGRGFSGVVLDAGPGVTSLELGDEVWGCLSEWSPGAASELLVVTSGRVAKRPRALAADGAASLPWAGGAALSALARLRLLQDGRRATLKRACVSGAASGEGCALTQLLAARGATVTATAPAHAHSALRDAGAKEVVDLEKASTGSSSWSALEQLAAKTGPWDCVFSCEGVGVPPSSPPATAALLKSTAPRNAVIELRPRALLTDRLPTPFAFVFTVSFYAYRALRYVFGLGTNPDWLEDKYRLNEGLTLLTELVDSGQLSPFLDKVYLPEEFEAALAHACSEDAIGTTVIRFP